VLLVRRNPVSRLMGGVWVFPGGSVEPGEGSGERALRAAAARELWEEAGIEVDPERDLIGFARWITPRRLLARFDAWFFVTCAPADAAPRVDGVEIVDFRWIEPAAALAAATHDELTLVFPTIKQLQRLSGFGSVTELLAALRDHEVIAVEPHVIETGGKPRIVLPGEPGYEPASPIPGEG